MGLLTGKIIFITVSFIAVFMVHRIFLNFFKREQPR